VGVLTQLAHGIIGLGGQNSTGIQTVLQVKVLDDVRDITNDVGTEHGASQTGTVAEETNALRLVGGELDVAEQAGKTGVDGSSVHVTAEGSDLKTGLHTLGETLLGQGHEGLLDSLVGQRSSVVNVTELGGDLGEGRVGGVGQEVVIEHTSVGLLDQLAGGGVVQNVVKAVETSLGFSSTVGTILDSLEGLLTSTVGLVAGINGLSVAAKREVTVNDGVFAGKVGLVEVVGVGNVRGTQTGLENNRGIRTDQHGNAASTTSGASRTSGVQSNVTADNDSVTTVPGRGLEPVNAVEDSVGTTVAGVDGIDTLDVGVAVGGEQLHQDRLDGLGLVQQSLSSDFQTTNGLGVNVVLLHHVGKGGEGHRVDVYRAIDS